MLSIAVKWDHNLMSRDNRQALSASVNNRWWWI